MRDYLFSGLNEAAAYTRLENICPGGISKWSKESEYLDSSVSDKPGQLEGLCGRTSPAEIRERE